MPLPCRMPSLIHHLPASRSLIFPPPARPSFATFSPLLRSPQVRVSKEEGNVTFSRSGLAQWLIDTARKRYPGRINYYFQAAADKIDLQSKKVSWVGGPGLGGLGLGGRYDLANVRQP